MNSIRMRKLIIAVVVAAGVLTGISVASAQTQNKTEKKQTTSQTKKVGKLELHGKIFDRRTLKEVPFATIAILRPDSSLVAGAEGFKQEWKYDDKSGILVNDTTSDYTVTIPRIAGEYLVRVTIDGYEPHFEGLNLKNLGSREIKRDVPNIYITPEKSATTLDAVTVSATKIKFYNKGDTVVYNADAFMLPEGSSLDALIAQMPGVEMKEGGKIYVNGKYVESLLLNGKDFFKGNQQVMLENIGAYAVKDIQVYDKLGNLSELTGQRVDDDSEYVMDVRLKKDYLTGWMVNAEAGYALPGNHYLGKVFAMMENTNTRISVYGNVNDLNDTNRPSDGRGYQLTGNRNTGVTSVANGGVDYNVSDSRKEVQVSGNVDVNYTDRNLTHDQYTTNFLTGGDTYGYSFSDTRMMNLSVSTNHELKIKKEHWNLKVNPEFKYNHSIEKDISDEVTLSENFPGITRSTLQALYSGDFEEVRKALINHNRVEGSERSHGIESSLRAELNLKPAGMSDAISVLTEGCYNRSSSFLNESQMLNFGAGPSSSNLYENYEPTRPSYRFFWRGGLRYYFYTPFGRIKLAYEYRHSQDRNRHDIYTREAYATDGLAVMPPDLAMWFDADNSTNSKLYQNIHYFQPSWTYDHKAGANTWKFTFSPTVGLKHRHLFYQQGENDINLRRTSFIADNAKAQVRYVFAQNGEIGLSYRLDTNTANLLDMVDITNNSDPLNIQEGNPDLKDSWAHNVWFNANYRFSKRIGLYGYVQYMQTDRDIVKGYRYESTTGIRTYKSYNVTGSYSCHYNVGAFGQFGKGDCLNYGVGFSAGNNRWAAMIGEDAEPVEQRVTGFNYGGHIGIGYTGKYLGINANVFGQADRTGSAIAGFEPSTSYLIAPNMTLQVKGIKGFSFSTDFGVPIRRGFSDPSLNTEQYMLAANASYTIPGGNWILKLTAYDLLNQYKTISYNISASSRVDNVYNTMPRYVMLSVTYRFNSRKR